DGLQKGVVVGHERPRGSEKLSAQRWDRPNELSTGDDATSTFRNRFHGLPSFTSSPIEIRESPADFCCLAGGRTVWPHVGLRTVTCDRGIAMTAQPTRLSLEVLEGRAVPSTTVVSPTVVHTTTTTVVATHPLVGTGTGTYVCTLLYATTPSGFHF